MNFLDKIGKFEFINNTGLINMTSGFFVLYLKYIFAKENKPIVVVSPSIFEARKLFNKFNENETAVLFENDDICYGDDASISSELLINRINDLNDLLKNDKKVIFTDILGYIRKLPDVNCFNKSKINIKCGKIFDRDELILRLNELGYNRETMVSKTAEYALRGFVLDIFPINEDNPVRIEFFGDEIESIKYFDIDSQKSTDELNNLCILPAREDISCDFVCLCDYLKDPIVIFKDYEQLKFSYEKLVKDTFYYGFSDNKLFFDFEDIKCLKKLYYFDIDNEISLSLKEVFDFNVKSVPMFNENFDKMNDFVKNCVKNGKTVLIFAKMANFNYFLDKLNFSYVITNSDKIFGDKINIIKENCSEGFEFNNYVVLTEYEMFNKKSVVVKRTRFKNASKIKDLSKIDIGDYVVHDLYGIGIYNGIRVLTKAGVVSDYLEVLYAKGDKLYIPAANIELISKYTGKDGYKPSINALNSSAWQKMKIKIREKIKYESARLIKVQAERQMKNGFVFSMDQPLQLMFESEFKYDETPDQLLAVNDIKRDMESSVPMDRILCGDVGYGKTEVAFRSMFKAILDNKQVLYLCPTTLLSKQQYEVALDRFKNYPVNIGILNRFVSGKDAKKVLHDLKEGRIDILFGTHRILSDDVICKDLGLLVVDEEQRFGVAHKEKIKEMKSGVDVLTLTATPIPRTLQMAVLGIRNLSLIETPPKNRKSVVTYVTGYDEKLVRDVIYKEISRGGQVFILYNRVEDIGLKANKLRSIVPDVSINYAHGQMDKNVFEDVMNNFVDKKFDVLICTTIIETGVDIPNVNTLIIIDADRFGLSQLYQIRGRVGRSDNLAYAYLLYDRRKVLTETAIKRLKVIKDFTELGSGFAIAMRDLSIRGAGDILGSEQAGFIDAVGMDLYLKMLNEEVNRLKGIEVNEDVVEDIDKINVSSHIKDNYVSDDDVKIVIHKLINSINSEEDFARVKSEIEDRFGKVDDDLIVYMKEQLFESYAKKLGIIKIFDNSIYREIVFDENKSSLIDYENLFVKSMSINNNFKFSYKNKRLVIALYYNKCSKHLVTYFNVLLKELN